MIELKCTRCNKELTESGALVFSPPQEHCVEKWHLCRNCWVMLRHWLTCTLRNQEDMNVALTALKADSKDRDAAERAAKRATCPTCDGAGYVLRV